MKNKQEQTNAWLPSGYEPPKQGGRYMKLADGENRIRILAQPIVGWLDWEDNKPVRFKMENKPLAPLNPDKSVKHFWAMVVWNCTEGSLQILEITQVSIQRRIAALSQDADWGDPSKYDIKINRAGKGMDTEYTVSPVPHKELSQEIIDAFTDTPINLEALYNGGDPFAVEAPKEKAFAGKRKPNF